MDDSSYSHCPNCHAEYRPGFDTCTECGIALVRGPAPVDDEREPVHAEDHRRPPPERDSVPVVLCQLPVVEAQILATKLEAEGLVVTVEEPALWTAYADVVKAANPFGAQLTSAGLRRWNFGTLQQRLELSTYVEVIWHRVFVPNAGGLLGVAGPMARSANDVRLLFTALSGYDSQDPFSAPVPLRAPQPDGTPIGVMEQFYDVPVEAGTRDTVLKAARVLGEIGFQVEPFKPRGIERAPNLWWFFFGQLPAPLTKQMIQGREQEAHWTGTEFLTTALEQPAPTANDLLSNLAARDRMRAALLRQMETVPLILAPVCGVAAFRHRERRWETDSKPIGLFEAMMPVTPWNLLGLPAMTVPFGMSADGLPIGVQLIGRPYEEELILEVGVRLEEARGPFPGPPAFSE